jgi:hypothetical protein
MTVTPLVQTLKSIIERSYGMPRVIGDLGPYIIGDEGLRSLYDGRLAPEGEEHDRPRLLVRGDGPTVRAAVYYPDALVRHLERFNPLAGIGDVNIDAFACLVEELDHLLTVASRASEGRQVTLLELESHAGVTKYLLVLHFLGKQARRRRLSEAHRRWARHHVFEKYSRDPDEEAARYRDAALTARRYVLYLETLPVPERHTELRAFQKRSFSETLRLVAEYN